LIHDIEALQKRLWKSADDLRANSPYSSNQYFFPVMGLIFLRHAYSRYLTVRAEIEATLPKRGGVPRPLTKEDFSQKSALYLRQEAQFDYLVDQPDNADRGGAINTAMQVIEGDYPDLLADMLPKEYHTLEDDLLGRLLRVFNDDELKNASGDVFGRIYEYFLVKFADQAAHDNGEFFTPVSLVQTIVNVIEPDHGRVYDPACGSGGMFVQSSHFVERHGKNPQNLTFYGQEKNPDTIKLAKMNLAVHGLSGNINQAISYYGYNEQPLHVGSADFVMANPPFNVDEVDAEKVKGDPRLLFGLPGVNKEKKVSNGNYLWISYFYSYLNETGRAGFVMSSQSSSAGRDEQKVRQALIETGHVDVMIAIQSGFFYTRTVPCELWFFDKAKAEAQRDKVLMIDARNVHRKVTRTIYDFSPEQLANLSSIVWLYRGQPERFLELVQSHLRNSLMEAQALSVPLAAFHEVQCALLAYVEKFLASKEINPEEVEAYTDLKRAQRAFAGDAETYNLTLETNGVALAAKLDAADTLSLHEAAALLTPTADACRDLVKQADLLYKLSQRLSDVCETNLDARASGGWTSREIGQLRRAIDNTRNTLKAQCEQTRYFFRHAQWLQERFPDAELRDVPGLVKLVSTEDIEAADWSLTPGRYVGVAPEEVDEGFNFEEAIKAIHVELGDLNQEATELADRIQENLETLGV
jgi:type I restriction enzyme M protein